MTLAFNDEQLALAESARRFLGVHSTSVEVRRLMESDLGFDPSVWERAAGELGWTAIAIPESYGGLGLGAVEISVLMEEMGRNLFCAPFLSTVCLVNPLTVVPVYYLAYRIGCLALSEPQGRFSFALSWDWLQNGLGPMWKPFLAGCGICALVVGVSGWLLLELMWRRQVIKKYRARRGASSG